MCFFMSLKKNYYIVALWSLKSIISGVCFAVTMHDTRTTKVIGTITPDTELANRLLVTIVAEK